MARLYKLPNDSTPVGVSPSSNGNIVRLAFLLESLANLGTVPLITHPTEILPYLLRDASQISPATILFARLFSGVVVGGLTVALWLGIPNTRAAIESRRTIYYTLGMGEVTLIPMLIMEMLKGGGKDAALTPLGSVVAIMSLAPLLVWRAYVLFVRPDLVGRYKEVVKRE